MFGFESINFEYVNSSNISVKIEITILKKSLYLLKWVVPLVLFYCLLKIYQAKFSKIFLKHQQMISCHIKYMNGK